MMQRYWCTACRMEHPSILAAWLHVFTDHWHRDMALEPNAALAMLQTMAPDHSREWTFWPDMVIEPVDMRFR